MTEQIPDCVKHKDDGYDRDGEDLFGKSREEDGQIHDEFDHWAPDSEWVLRPELILEVDRYVAERSWAPQTDVLMSIMPVDAEEDAFFNYGVNDFPSPGFLRGERELEETFSLRLRRLIAAKGMDDVDVYKRANISRQHWSKMIGNKWYQPGKRTVLALAIALRLNLDETLDLLMPAGYTLSKSLPFDLIVEYFIVNQNYDIFELNEVLFKYEQPVFG
jgi:hypothetical protein